MVHRHDRPRVVGSPACPLVQTSGRRSAVSSCRDHWPNRIGRLRGEMHGAPASERPGQATPLGWLVATRQPTRKCSSMVPKPRRFARRLTTQGAWASAQAAALLVPSWLAVSDSLRVQRRTCSSRSGSSGADPGSFPAFNAAGDVALPAARPSTDPSPRQRVAGTISSRRDHEVARHVGTRRTALKLRASAAASRSARASRAFWTSSCR